MVSAWDVYWVMQLDSISAGITAMAILWPIVGCLGSMVLSDYTKDVHWPACVGLCMAVLFGFAAMLIPNSKTAAAMIVLPAITSDAVLEPVGKEAKELYVLAKQALSKVAQEPAAPTEEKK